MPAVQRLLIANQLTALALYASPTWLACAKKIIALWP